MLFEADPDFIASLDSLTLVRLMKRLVLAESRLANIPLRDAAVPLQITIADGGEDGRVEWTGGLEATAYLPHRFTLLQAKAQDLAEASIKREILKKPKKKAASTLSPAISEVLAKNGAYLVFCRERMTTPKRKKLVAAIRNAIIEGGGDAKKAAAIDVYDANLIADWVNTHPSVALWLASLKMGRNLAGFQTHEGWGAAPEYRSTWRPSDEPRFSPVNRSVPTDERKDPKRGAWTYDQAAVETLRFLSSEKSIVRIFGPSGFGKSRFAYEVLGQRGSIADQIDHNSVIYCDASISGDETTRLALELADASLVAILVVDECPDDLHLKLASIVKRTNSRLRLVTLDIETKVLQASDTLSIRVEKSDDKLIEDIAKGVAPSLSDGDTQFIAELADGFPRMAVLAAQQDAGGRQTLVSAEQILERIIWSGKHRVPDAQRVLEIASLFEWIGLQDRVESQVTFLAAELAQMPTALFVEHLLSFKPRGIITQRGDFAQVAPIPLAARLGLARLSVMTPALLLQVFEKAPDELKSSLLRRIKWMDTSPTAVAFAERLLDPQALGNFAALNTEYGSKTLDRLVHVAPDAVAMTIDRAFGTLTPDQLKAARDGRRHLVWSLEKLAFRTQTFDRAARMLLKLAVAENEDYGNSASGIFKQLYQLYLSGTEADPAARLRVLDDGLSSGDETEIRICVDALGHMLDSGHYSRGGGAEQIGSAEALEDWSPKTYGEIWNFFREAMARLERIALSNARTAPIAKKYLSGHIRGLLRQLPAVEVKAMIDKITANDGFWPEALSAISSWLYFDREKGTPKKVAKEIRALYDNLLPSDPVDLAVLYTHGWTMDHHDPDSKYDPRPNAKHDFEYSSRQAIAVAQDIAKDKDLVRRATARLACTDFNGLLPFAVELAKSVPDPEELFNDAVQVAEASSNAPNRSFFGGLIAGTNGRDPELAETLIRAALQSPKLKADAITLLGAGSMQSDDVALLISLLKSGDVKPWQCQNLGLWRIDPALFIPVLDELQNHGNDGLWTILDIMGMYFHGNQNAPTKELLKLIKGVLTNPALMDSARDNMCGYHMEQMVERLVKLGAIDEPYAKRLAKQCLRICRQGTDRVFYDLDDPVRKILGHLIAMHPRVVWAEVAKKLTSKSWYERFYAGNLLEARHRDDHLDRGLSFPVPISIYLDWVREKPADRAALAVPWLPIAEKDDAGQLRWHTELEAFVDEFGEQPDVLSALSMRLSPNSYWGGLARYLEPVVPLVESWSTHPEKHIREWVATQLERLRKTIAVETKRSEEDVVRYG